MFRFIEAEKANFPISVMCEVLDVSKAGFYAWGKRPQSDRAQRDALILGKIRCIHTESRQTYGAPRIHFELADEHDLHCGRKRVARLMAAHGIRGCSRRRRHWTTKKDRSALPSADLLERDFSADAPDKRWVADIERHEALWNRAVMKGHRLRSLAGVRRSWGQPDPRGRGGGQQAAPTTPGRASTVRWCGSGKQDGKV